MGKILFDVFEINIAVSIVILLVAVLAEILRKRYGAGWLRIVWILLAVRLLIPYNFSLPNTEIRLFNTPGFEQETYTELYMNEEALSSDEITSEADELLSGKDTDIAETMPEQEMQSPAVQMEHGTNLTMHEENSDYYQTGKELPLSEKQMNDVAEETVETNALLYTRILLCVWGIGVIAFGAYYAFAYMWFQYRSHKKLCPILDEALRERIESIQLKYLSKVKCSVYESEAINTPMLMGIFTPKLVLPTDCSSAENNDKNKWIPTERWSDEELEMVVAHELCHYQNKDLWLKIIMLIACCINWFNPAVHFMKKQFFCDLELACDYRVLRNCNANEKQQYAEVLLKYAGKETSFSAGLSANKKRLKNRISHMWENEKKKNGIPAFILIAVLLISVGLFISCGYKPEEVSDEPITEPNPVSDESVAEHNEEQYAEFDYNNETNKMVRRYNGITYLAQPDGIYKVVDGEMIRIYGKDGDEYRGNRGMELYGNALYFVGSAEHDAPMASTVYRMDLDTLEVTDALAKMEEEYEALFDVTIYEGNLYVDQNMYGKIGFTLDENGLASAKIDDTTQDFLYRDYNDSVQLNYAWLNNMDDNALLQRYKENYSCVIDKAECMELLNGKYVVTRYKDEMSSSVYLTDGKGNYQFMCDTYYSSPMLVTDKGIYYHSIFDEGIFFVDYAKQTQQCIKECDSTPGSLYLLTYDEAYIYYSVEEYVWGENEGEWTEKHKYIKRLSRAGGEPEVIFTIKEAGVAITGQCGIDTDYMYFLGEFDGQNRIDLKKGNLEGMSESQQSAEESNVMADFGREDEKVQTYLASFPQECDEIIADGRAVCVTYNTFEQKHLWAEFLRRIQDGYSASVVVMTVTDEGDPILYYIHYDGTDYMVVRDTHRDHFGTPCYTKDKYRCMSEIKNEETEGYVVVLANEAFKAMAESDAYWEKVYAQYEAGEIDPYGENEYQPFPLRLISTVWKR